MPYRLWAGRLSSQAVAKKAHPSMASGNGSRLVSGGLLQRPWEGHETLALAFLLGAVFALSTIKIFSFDFWWHLNLGREIAISSGLPGFDSFSFTAGGEPWKTNSWLFDVFLYLLYAATGPNGVIFAKAIVVTTLAAILSTRLRKEGVWICLIVAVLLIAVLTSRYRWMARPHMASLFFLVISNEILHRCSRTNYSNKRLAWIIPVVIGLWANCHAGVLFGLLLIAGYTAGAAIEAFLHRGTPGAGKKDSAIMLLKVLVVSIIASGISPIGFGYLGYLFNTLIYDTSIIDEYRPTLFANFHLLYLYAFSLAAGMILSWRRLRIHHWLLVGGFGIMAFKISRLVPYFAWVSAPVWAVSWQSLIAPSVTEVIQKSKGWRALLSTVSGALSITVTAGMLSLGNYVDHKLEPAGFGFYQPNYTFGGVSFLNRHRFDGNLFNDLMFGGHIGWAVRSGTGVFLDGRIPLFHEVLNYMSTHPPDQVLEKYRIDHALVSIPTDTSFAAKDLSMAIYLLSRRENWALVYFDDTALIFVKRIPKYGNLIKNYEYRVLNPTRLDSANNVFQYRPAHTEAFMAEIERSKKGAPVAAAPYYFEGRVFELRGKNKDAIDIYRKGLSLNPDAVPLLVALGNVLVAENNIAAARRQYRAALAISDGAMSAKIGIGVTYMNVGNLDRALPIFRELYQTAPSKREVLLNLLLCEAVAGNHDNVELLLSEAKKLGISIPESHQKVVSSRQKI